jgi:hypothetical protein
MVQVCVVIPFRGDAHTLSWVLDGFAAQQLPPNVRVEVRVGGDDCAPPAPPAASSDGQICFTTKSFPRSGAAVVRNHLLEGVASDVVIFVNSDVRPDVHFVAAHVSRLLSLPEGFMVLGSAPYETGSYKTIFDSFKEETPAIFFYHQLPPHQYYDYRYGWTINLSVRSSDFRKAGGFHLQLRPYGYEDLDFAHRLIGDKTAIYYDPAAAVTHRHPMTFDQYLDREEGIGCVAPALSQANPSMFHSLFGQRGVDELAKDYRVWTSMDVASHRWIYQRFFEWSSQPDQALGVAGSEERSRLLLTLYQMHIPLKRLAFRLGFLRGMELIDAPRWQERKPIGAWKQLLGV